MASKTDQGVRGAFPRMGQQEGGTLTGCSSGQDTAERLEFGLAGPKR